MLSVCLLSLSGTNRELRLTRNARCVAKVSKSYPSTTSGPRIVARGARFASQLSEPSSTGAAGAGTLQDALRGDWRWPQRNASRSKNRELACKRSRAELWPQPTPSSRCSGVATSPLTFSTANANPSLPTSATPIAICAQNQHKQQKPASSRKQPSSNRERCDANQPATPKGLVSRTPCGLTKLPYY